MEKSEKVSVKIQNCFKKFKSTDFVKEAKWFNIAGAAILFIGILVLSIWGMNLGIDFTGGSVVQISVKDRNVNESEIFNDEKNKIETALSSYGIIGANIYVSETDDGPAIVVKYQNKSSNAEQENTKITNKLLAVYDYTSKDDILLIKPAAVIDASADSKILISVISAILVSSVLILIYITIRFEVTSGFTALIIFLHDILVMLSLVTIFRIQVNSSFIAAVAITMIFSVSNTVLLFGRIKENVKKDNNKNLKINEIANVSVSQTVVRCLTTSVITLTATLLFIIIGVPGVREIAFPIFLGLAVATVSSLFMAATLWVFINKNNTEIFKEKKKKVSEEKKESGKGTVEAEIIESENSEIITN